MIPYLVYLQTNNSNAQRVAIRINWVSQLDFLWRTWASEMLRSGKNCHSSIVRVDIRGILSISVRHQSMDQSAEMLRRFFSVVKLVVAWEVSLVSRLQVVSSFCAQTNCVKLKSSSFAYQIRFREHNLRRRTGCFRVAWPFSWFCTCIFAGIVVAGIAIAVVQIR